MYLFHVACSIKEDIYIKTEYFFFLQILFHANKKLFTWACSLHDIGNEAGPYWTINLWIKLNFDDVTMKGVRSKYHQTINRHLSFFCSLF